ncbi:hypothetical protein DFH09DRAFT_1336859 [Mycena vulgaris]|nr:hypothetical protein DFH09DRAFT_1336859 [Mycena vulgaris]
MSSGPARPPPRASLYSLPPTAFCPLAFLVLLPWLFRALSFLVLRALSFLCSSCALYRLRCPRSTVRCRAALTSSPLLHLESTHAAFSTMPCARSRARLPARTQALCSASTTPRSLQRDSTQPHGRLLSLLFLSPFSRLPFLASVPHYLPSLSFLILLLLVSGRPTFPFPLPWHPRFGPVASGPISSSQPCLSLSPRFASRNNPFIFSRTPEAFRVAIFA